MTSKMVLDALAEQSSLSQAQCASQPPVCGALLFPPKMGGDSVPEYDNPPEAMPQGALLVSETSGYAGGGVP